MMKCRIKFNYIIIFAIIYAFTSCKSFDKAGKQNIANIYDSRLLEWQPSVETKVIQDENTSYSLLAQLDQRDFQMSFSDNYTLNYQLQWFLSEGYYSGNYIDSSDRLKFIDTISIEERKLVYRTSSIPVEQEGGYVLKIRISDLNSGNSFDHFVSFDVNNLFDNSNILISSNDDYLLNHIGAINKTYKIELKGRNYSQLKVNYHLADNMLAIPPFSIKADRHNEYLSDTSYVIDVINNYVNFTPEVPGIYCFCSPNDSQTCGAEFFIGEFNYPEISDAEQMYPPLRYITAIQEYENIGSEESLKTAIDKFWLKAGETPDRAKLLISRYYKRVTDANKWFTSYKEGWTTDRGMVLIIYGTPNIVYKDDRLEHWIYGEDNHPYSIYFDFEKNEQSLSNNDYRLSRSTRYKENWYRAVERWRQ